MARPVKQGIDYFPLDNHTDDKIEIIEAKYGLLGFAILIKLLQRIYRESYYIVWDERTSLLFCKHNNINIEECNNIIADFLKEDILHLELYNKYNILTSSGIQKRYFKAVERRSGIVVVKELTLIDVSANNNFIFVNINDSATRVSDNMMQAETTQKKEEDKKSKKKKEENIVAHESKPYELAVKLSEYILSNNPKAKAHSEATLQKWARAIDKLNRIDEQPWDDISEVIEWCQNSDFWLSNILSGDKLRAKYQTLYMQMQRKGGDNGFGKGTKGTPSEAEKNQESPNKYAGRSKKITLS